MNRVTLIAAVLLAVAVAHVLRILFHVEAIIGGAAVPMWVSVAAAGVAGGMAILLWRGRPAN